MTYSLDWSFSQVIGDSLPSEHVRADIVIVMTSLSPIFSRISSILSMKKSLKLFNMLFGDLFDGMIVSLVLPRLLITPS